jgi:drug/metabolite transporter (DMT)-like permease
VLRNALRGKVLAAYITLCLVWGSTFLAIRIGVRSFPPALFSGTRFLTAGLILLAFALALGRRLPQRVAEWKTSAVVGILLLTLGNGLVVAGSRFVESGTAAILVLGGALWMSLLDAVIPGSEARVTLSQLAGLIVGYAGTLLLNGSNLAALRRADWRGPLFFIGSNICWGLGTVYSKRHPTETRSEMNSAIQMMIGGLCLVVIGTVTGEWNGFDPTPAGWGAIVYLMVFGSIIGYSCFLYVLRHTSPTITSTYYYVNTIVALLLGAAVLGERITVRTVAAVILVLGSVVWVQRSGKVEKVVT